MFYDTQEMLLRRKLEEQADLQQAIELQGRRIMNLQLLDFKNHQYHPQQYHHGLSVGSPIPSPTLTRAPDNPNLIFPSDGIDQQVPTGELVNFFLTIEMVFVLCKNNDNILCLICICFAAERNGDPVAAVSQTCAVDADQQLQQEVSLAFSNGHVDSRDKEEKSYPEENDLPERYES